MMSEVKREVINYQFHAPDFIIGGEQRKERAPRRPPLKDMIEAAKKAGVTVKGAVIRNGEVLLEFGEPTAAAASNGMDKAIEKAIRRD